MRARMLVPAALLAALAACADDPRPAAPLPPGRVRTELTYLKDAHDRTLFLHGINLGGSTKVPKTVDGRAIGPADMGLAHNTGVPSYVGRPWDLSGCAFLPGGAFDPASEPDCQAAREVRKLRDAGFNLFRFLINWEGIAPTAPDQYDRAYLATIAQNVAIANHYGVYMLLDMHQDAYSRHLVARYNEKPSYKDKDGNTVYPPRGTLENTLLALMPPYTDAVRGEGAPRWAVEACLFEKDLDAPTWGQPRLVSGLADANLSSLIDLITGFLGESEGPPVIPDWVETFLGGIAPASAPVTGTSDLLPFTIWGIMAMTSVDVVRNFACLLSGDFGDDDPYGRGGAFNGHLVDGEPVSTYLQRHYAAAWHEVVRAIKAHHDGTVPDNVIGYDPINEPIGFFVVMSAASAIFNTGLYQSARTLLVDLLGAEQGQQYFDLLTALRLLPEVPDKPADDAPQAAKDAWAAEIARIEREWGFQYTDFLGVVGLNIGYDRNYMTPFYEVVGRAIYEEDPDAVIWFEPSLNVSNIAGLVGSAWWDTGMTRPRICRCADPASPLADKAVSCDVAPADCADVREAGTVFAPHHYADIYPNLGFNWPSREFTVEEVRHRDYDEGFAKALKLVEWNLGNIPAAFGEFGTYYNFGGIEKSHAQDYAVSAHLLDNYYESLERMFLSRMLWCYTPDNDPRYGDWWNKEDFSIWRGWTELTMDEDIGLALPITDPAHDPTIDGAFRAQDAWSRPYPRFLAGRPLDMHFYSPYHYFDPIDGVVNPEREFQVRYIGRDSEAPTEVFVPAVQYPEGFYVWVSDGFCRWDPETRVLYHFPTDDAPGTVHTLRLLPPLPGRVNAGWRYFVQGDRVIEGQPRPGEE